MTKKNIDHIASHANRGSTYWEFCLPSNVETCKDQAEEMVKHCETLFSTFEDFLIPLELEYSIHRFPTGQSLPVRVKGDNHLERVKIELQEDDGITVDDFSESIDVSKPGSRYIPRIPLNNCNKVNVNLECGDVYVSKSNHMIEYRNGSPVNDSVTWNPIDLTVLFGKNRSGYNIGSDYVFCISVSTHSDIWFDDAADDANREYLSKFLGRIESTLPVEEINRFSEWYSVSDLEYIF